MLHLLYLWNRVSQYYCVVGYLGHRSGQAHRNNVSSCFCGIWWHLCLCLQTQTSAAGDWLREREQDYYICRDKKEGGWNHQKHSSWWVCTVVVCDGSITVWLWNLTSLFLLRILKLLDVDTACPVKFISENLIFRFILMANSVSKVLPVRWTDKIGK